MTQVTKSTMIGELLKYRYALSRMPVFPDGDHRRGCYGSWN